MSTIQVSPENHAEIKRYCARHGQQIGAFADAVWQWLKPFDIDIFEGTPYIPAEVSGEDMMPIKADTLLHEIQGIRAEHRNDIKAIIDALSLPNLLSQGVEYGRQIAEAEIKRKEQEAKHQEEINLITEGAEAKIKELEGTIKQLEEQLQKCRAENLKYYGAYNQLKENVELHKWYHGKIEIPEI